MTGDASGWYRIYGVAALLLLLALGLEEAGEFLGALAGVFAVAAHAATTEPTRLRH